MKKIVSVVLILMLLIAGLFGLTGCNETQEEVENTSENVVKEYETQSITTTDGTATVSFEFEKSDKYKVSAIGNTIVIKNNENYSEVQVRLLHDSIFSTSITKEEKDFNEDYHDYKEVKIGDFSGWEVYKKEFEYETVLVLSEKEEKTNKVYAVGVKVIKSSIMKEDMTFDTAEFIEGEDFRHLLNSIKITMNEE